MKTEHFKAAPYDFELTVLKSEIARRYKKTPLCYIHSYGCQQSVLDGERLAGKICKVGFDFTDDPFSADLILLNTCAVRENAHERVYGRIGELKHVWEKNSDVIICVCGCMVQQPHVVEKIKNAYPYVKLLFGTFAFNDLYKMLLEVMTSGKRVINIEEKPFDEDCSATLHQSSFKASVAVMHGCNNFCTYCVVPYVRGRERSREPEAVIAEVKKLVGEGFKEITLLGQNVNSYSYGFPELLRQLNEIEGDFWIRFMSSHPKDAGKELIDAIFDCKKVCTQLHLPVQSGNNEILRRMNRRYSVEDYLKIVNYARERDPDFSFTTDILVGFPGETYEQFSDTKALARRVKYDNIYSFVYSKRESTAAAKLDDPISEKQKGLWLHELLLEQRKTSEQWLARFVGKKVRVLVEGKSKKSGVLLAKSYQNIIVELNGADSLIGSFQNARINKAFNWALLGEIEN